MVMDFTMNPKLEENFIAQGCLYCAGMRTHQMNTEQYRKTWKLYENMMVIVLENSIKCALEMIEKCKKYLQRR